MRGLSNVYPPPKVNVYLVPWLPHHPEVPRTSPAVPNQHVRSAKQGVEGQRMGLMQIVAQASSYPLLTSVFFGAWKICQITICRIAILPKIRYVEFTICRNAVLP